MEGHSMFFVLFLAIIKLNAHLTEAATVEETCLLVKDKSYIADPADCQGWAYCLNGKPIYGKCNTGFLYDSARGICNYADQVACNANVTTMCTGLSNVYKADPYNCQNYCYCDSGVAYTASCPTGQFYNPSSVSCVWAAESTCVPNSPCLLVQNTFIKDTSSCNGWIRCGNGQRVDSGICPPGYNYVASTGLCDYAANAPCSSTPVVPGTPPIPDGACGKGPAGALKNFFVGDQKTCRGYFFCASPTDPAPVWGQCPKNSQFNFATQQCNDPWSVVCTYDRCDGSTKSFLAVANTGCKQYSICSGGISTGTGSCPSDYPIFNDLAGVCQKATLDYPICATSAPVPTP